MMNSTERAYVEVVYRRAQGLVDGLLPPKKRRPAPPIAHKEGLDVLMDVAVMLCRLSEGGDLAELFSETWVSRARELGEGADSKGLDTLGLQKVPEKEAEKLDSGSKT